MLDMMHMGKAKTNNNNHTQVVDHSNHLTPEHIQTKEAIQDKVLHIQEVEEVVDTHNHLNMDLLVDNNQEEDIHHNHNNINNRHIHLNKATTKDHQWVEVEDSSRIKDTDNQ